MTKKCPLKCLHCFNDSGESLEKEMTKEEFLEVFKKLEYMGISRVFVTGGEPTSRKDFIEILSEISKRFKAIIVASNGFYFSEEFVLWCKEFRNVVWQISMDGTEETHNHIRGIDDAFKRTENAIRLLVKHHIPVVISFTIMPINDHEIEDIIKYGKEVGATQVLFGKILNIGRAANRDWDYSNEALSNLDERLLQLKEQYESDRFFIGQSEDNGLKERTAHNSNCGAGHVIVCIKPNGDVTPCANFDFRMGNLLRDDIDEIFSSNKIIKIRELLSPTLEFCGDCKKYGQCDGCHGIPYTKNFKNCIWNEQFKENFDQIT